MLKIGICDDDSEIRSELHSFCERFFGEGQCEISHYGAGEEFLEKGCGGARPDILLLDIEMEGMDGIQVKNILQRQKEKIRILFAEELYGKELAETIQKETDVSVYYLDPLVRGPYEPDSYIEGMQKNIDLLKAAFGV